MKKISLFLVFVMLLSLLPACGSEDKKPSNDTTPPTLEANPNAAVILDCANLTMPVGAEMELVASLIPRFDTDDTTLSFESTNASVASVTANGNVGKITALSEGSAIIVVKSADGLLAASCQVTVIKDSLPPDNQPTEGSITPEKSAITVKVGDSGKINATVVPTNEGDDTTLTFATDSDCIDLSSDGSFQAKKEGVATVTLTTAAGLSATVTITVLDEDADLIPNPNAGIILEKSEITLKVGESGKINATVIVAFEGDSTQLSYKCGSTCIQFTDNGNFIAKSEGKAIVTLSTAEGLSATVTITVLPKEEPKPNPNAGITLDKSDLSLTEGEKANVNATLIPRFDTDDTTLTFESSNKAVATVNATGNIVAMGKGTAVITVTSADGLLSASLTVTVKAKPSDNPNKPKIVNYPANQVRHIFSHCLIAYPEMGCGDPAKGNGSLDVDCLTVSEFQILLQSLYDNGYCLIDINDMYENYTDANGVRKARLKQYVQVYEGKKPLVISVDDVVYDSRKLDWGMIDRLEIKNDTIVGMKMINGKAVYSDLEIFPQLEKFVASHPDFSFEGAKCTLALTGFEGILGYRTDDQFAEQGIDYMAEREKAKVVVNWLKANGYNFASHSYSHSNYGTCSQSRVDRDIERWNSQVKPLIGETQVFVYPYGAFTYYGTETHNKLLKEGFTIFCGTSQTNCLWDGKHPKKRDSNGSTIASGTGSIYLERYTITGQTLRDWRDFPSMYDYCDPYATYDHENRFIPMPKKSED